MEWDVEEEGNIFCASPGWMFSTNIWRRMSDMRSFQIWRRYKGSVKEMMDNARFYYNW